MKELKINVPEGYEIDKENSTFECIKFKPVEKRWRDTNGTHVSGYYISEASEIHYDSVHYRPCNYNVFTTKKQVKSALAMARISQIMANDERFGGAITDEEWNNASVRKFTIGRYNNHIGINCYTIDCYSCAYCFLAFHTAKQRDLFLKENEDLVKEYLMVD